MIKVKDQWESDGGTRLGTITTGYCAKCDTEVVRHAKGIDEICPCCGEFLDWSTGIEEDE